MIKKYARLYMRFCAQYLKALMEYRVDFLIGLSGFLVTQATGIIFIFIVFQNIPELNGWSYDGILFIYAFAQLPRGIDHLSTDNLWLLSGRIIVKGDFDRCLLRPVNPLFHLVAERFQPDAFGELIVGFVVLFYSAARLKLSFGLLDIALFVFAVICGAVIYTSIKLFFASIAFWVKNSQSILYLNYSLSDFAKYPINIYTLPIKVILTFIVPFGFTAFFPAAYFVQKESFFIGIVGTFIAAAVTFTIAYYTWSKGIKAYESAGN